MNAFEKWFCGSAIWRYITRRQLLPWLLQGTALGDHVLELGAGPGAGTLELARRSGRATSIEYDHTLATKLAKRISNSGVRVIQADAAALPFADKAFSSAIAILMLHHLKSPELQDRAFSEIARVLRPGGIFIACDIPDGWTHRVAHIRSTFVPLDPTTAKERLTAAGFSGIRLDFQGSIFRIQAVCPLESRPH
jgi:ubiquinone/menaquinone biosynthesis C-methylase UbiE